VKFKVTWIPSAENRLAELWLGSRIASQITRAADRLDTLLAENPSAVGESRSEDFRIAFESPLAITFLVDEAASEVVILHVWILSRPIL
jgi:hypothetical protein